MCDTDFCFKCHRTEANGEGDAYTVNCISFNKIYNTFSTAGSDGTFINWNKDTKSRYKSSKAAPLPMTACCFSEDATILAFASGEDWSKGVENTKKQPNLIKLYIRKCDKEDAIKEKNDGYRKR